MDAETLVLALLDALPEREIPGKKRLQKLSYLAAESGVSCKARFFLHDFGPFSAEVAAATDFLLFLGDVRERDIQFGRAKRYLKLYRLDESARVPEKLPKPVIGALQTLNAYSTIELEIASTIRYFMSKGMNVENAVEETQQLKPSKAVPRIVNRAREALLKAGLYEGRRKGQMSSSQSY
jgi:uncharacterized protein YwgA